MAVSKTVITPTKLCQRGGELKSIRGTGALSLKQHETMDDALLVCYIFFVLSGIEVVPNEEPLLRVLYAVVPLDHPSPKLRAVQSPQKLRRGRGTKYSC